MKVALVSLNQSWEDKEANRLKEISAELCGIEL